MMKLNLHSTLAVALAAALIVPALAFSQGPAPEPEDDPGAPPAMMHDAWPDCPMRHWQGGGPGMGMGMGPGMGMGMGMGTGMGMGMHRGGHGMGLGWVIDNPKLREKLGITSEQAAKIRQEALSFQKAEIRNRADLQIKRLELHSLLAADTPDRAAIDKNLQEANAAQLAVEKAAIDHQLAMRAMLTPEQREKLQQVRSEFGHRGPGPGGPRGKGGMMMHHRGGGMMRQGAPAPSPAPPPQQ
jgi:Spy/CpxP family protein refolding chaperone